MSVEFWENWEKPWNSEQARRRYVEGAEITQRTLAKDAGVHRSTIAKWSTESTLDGKPMSWKDQRELFQTKVRAKTLEKSSDRLAEDYAEVHSAQTKKHLKALNDLFEVSARWLDYLRRALIAAESGKAIDPEIKEGMAELRKWGGRTPHVTYTTSLLQAIAGIRRELNMDAVHDQRIVEQQANMVGLGVVPLEELEGSD